MKVGMPAQSTAQLDFPQPSQSHQAIRVEGFGRWKDFVHDNFPWLEHKKGLPGEDFRAEVSAFSFGCGSLFTISADDSEVIRTRHLVEAADSGCIKLLWQIDGGMRIEQDGRQSAISPGRSTVCDSARPYRITLSEQARFAVLMLPYDACPGWQNISQKICGAELGSSASLRAAFGALMALMDGGGVPDPSGEETVIKAIQWMVTTSLHSRASELSGAASIDARLSKAQRHILSHIGDPCLDAGHLAAALCMSRRSLYMLFKEYHLTPARMIHDLRLEQTMLALGNASQRHRKITDIAFEFGFTDYATFSRLFKAQYGLTPSEHRMKIRTIPASLGH